MEYERRRRGTWKLLQVLALHILIFRIEQLTINLKTIRALLLLIIKEKDNDNNSGLWRSVFCSVFLRLMLFRSAKSEWGVAAYIAISHVGTWGIVKWMQSNNLTSCCQCTLRYMKEISSNLGSSSSEKFSVKPGQEFIHHWGKRNWGISNDGNIG
jgi:hypothetical protein